MFSDLHSPIMFLVHEHDHANSLGGDLISISEIPFEFVWGLMQPCLNHPTPTPKDQEGVIQWDKEPPSLTTFSSKLILRWKVVSVTQGEEAGSIQAFQRLTGERCHPRSWQSTLFLLKCSTFQSNFWGAFSWILWHQNATILPWPRLHARFRLKWDACRG